MASRAGAQTLDATPAATARSSLAVRGPERGDRAPYAVDSSAAIRSVRVDVALWHAHESLYARNRFSQRTRSLRADRHADLRNGGRCRELLRTLSASPERAV